nr:hypothetical protein [uncultured Blautia sp.]
MELETAYHAIVEGRAVLLTGSGAHMGALNLNQKKFPSGGSLAETLYLE